MWRSQSTATTGGSWSRSRVSFELGDEEVEAAKNRLAGLAPFGNGNGNVANGGANGTPVDASFEQWKLNHPSIFEHMDAFKALLQGKRLAVFLDYDGTLTPIVSNPDDATMSAEMRKVVKAVASMFPTAIISGRGREKVEAFVQLKELFYAGSHGMDIAGPMVNGADGKNFDSAFQPAAHFRPLIDEVYGKLQDRLKDIPGSSVEHNNFCVSAHFRNCQGEHWQSVISAVEDIVADHDDLRMTRGRKVVEVRPKVDWHKGTALTHLVEALGLNGQPDVIAIYIGDDHTDEDAFKTLEETRQGFGILVSSRAKPTRARYTVDDPAAVQHLLSNIVEWGLTASNGWHSKPSCNGWAATPLAPS